MNKIKAFAIFLMLVALGSCRPESFDSISDYDLVFTSYDVNFSFESRRTYAMPDTVLIIGTDPDNREISPFNDVIISSLSRAMQSAGWQRIQPDDEAIADLVVLPMVTSTSYESCAMPCWECGWGYWDGWGSYPSDWGAGWGWYYPPVMSCSEFSTGSIYVVMSDPNNPNPTGEQIPVVWKGVADGLLQGSNASIASRIDVNISQMFIQSPYLKLEN